MPVAAQQTAAVESDNPLSGDPDAIVAGRRLFNTWCTQCHGGKANGEARFGKYAADLTKFSLGYTEFAAIVVAGRPDKMMPPWDGVLDGEQISQIGAFSRPSPSRAPIGRTHDDTDRAGACVAGGCNRRRPGAGDQGSALSARGGYLDLCDAGGLRPGGSPSRRRPMATRSSWRRQELHVRRRRRHRGHDGPLRHRGRPQGDKVKVEFWIEFYKKIAELDRAWSNVKFTGWTAEDRLADYHPVEG